MVASCMQMSERPDSGRAARDRWCTIELPTVIDPRGKLTFVEGQRHVPFPIRRTYWIYDVPGGEIRGGHAYRALEELVIAISGSFDVVLDDGTRRDVVQLNRSYRGVYVPPMTWRQLENFSTNGVCLILASLPYTEDDYIRDRDTFLALGTKP
jgi:dTDP-4-dehydrorhamnose 3,5-epimerase-like enzyme